MKRLQPFVVCWSILWTIAFPLIHTHPAHALGDAGHHPTPLTHTVFSADLPDEYGHHHDDVTRGTRSVQGASPLPLLSHANLSHPEIGFSVLTLSSDRKMSKACLLCFVPWASQPAPTATSNTHTTRVPIELPPLTLLSSSLSLRAPPVSTI